MTLSIEDVKKIAALARLELTGEELATYQEQLSAILDHADRLDRLDTENVPPTTSAVPIQNVMREDKVVSSLTLEEVLFNAPEQFQDQFLIQTVIDSE